MTDPDAALGLDKFTVGGWVKPSGLKPTPQPILAKYYPGGKAFYILRLQAGTGIPELLRGCPPYTSVAGTAPLVQNQWNQVLGTYDGGTLRLYVNGVKVKEVAERAGDLRHPQRLPAAAHRRRHGSCQRPGRRPG